MTTKGFESNASSGVLKLITVIQIIGNVARKHQNARKPLDTSFRLNG
jgi:hypothetical protein